MTICPPPLPLLIKKITFNSCILSYEKKRVPPTFESKLRPLDFTIVACYVSFYSGLSVNGYIVLCLCKAGRGSLSLCAELFVLLLVVVK